MNISKEVDQLYREHSGKLITSLVSFFKLSNLQLAEDIVQNTFLKAFEVWSEKGLPQDPIAWLFKVCKNKALNEFNKSHYAKSDSLDEEQLKLGNQQIERALMPYEIRDNQLRLLFATCHPDFSAKSRIILTLKTLAGFKVEEIAKSLGMQSEAVKKNLTRTKQLIKSKNLPLKIPFALQSKDRLSSVHHVLYLIFNEGYSASSGAQLIRKDLCLQALRLTKALLDEEKISTADTQALFALMIFNIARFDTRIDQQGDTIELKNQNRQLWDQSLIQQGIKYFNKAKDSKKWSKYHFEAAIASLHSTAPSFEMTNWQAILKLYDQLLVKDDSAFVRLNHSVALCYAGYPQEALLEVKNIKTLENNVLYWLCQAEICEILDKKEDALNLYLDALQKTNLSFEKRAIYRKIDQLGKLK